jgi:NADH-quinone oxidoreductase subunit H
MAGVAQGLTLVFVGLGVIAPFFFLLVALAVIPFGGTYEFESGSITLVIAPVQSAVLFVIALCALATLGPFRARGRAILPPGNVLDGVAHRTAYASALGLTLLPIFMIYGTMELGRIAEAQDTQFALLRALGELGVPDLPLGLGGMTAPLWGVLLNPAAFVLFLACAMEMTRKPRPRSRRGDEASLSADLRPMTSPYGEILTLTQLTQLAVIAALATVVFLGGWSIPWLDQATLIDGVAPYFGVAVATTLCAVAHVGAFSVKALCLVALQIELRASGAALARLTRIGWRWIVAAALVNALVTAAVILSVPVETP